MDTGQRIAGRWLLIDRAGRGGMGAVYRARDERTGELAAVKLLEGDAEAQRARFDREARVLSQLQHPGIVRYLAHGITEMGRRFLAMEWLDGCTLMDEVRGQRLSIDESLGMARQVASALAFAHAQGVVHRDIKPSNLFLVDGRLDDVRILDFGIARLARGADVTQTGVRIGTPSYMSPEQVRGLTDLDGRCDVFGLGVVLYQCLTRRRPFWSNDPRITLTKILTWDPPPVSQVVPGIPADLDDVVQRALAKERGDRLDAAELLEALEALGRVDGVGGTAVLTQDEQRLQSVIVAYLPGAGVDRLAPIAAGHDARVDTFGDKRLVAWLGSDGAATDLAARAARCALALKAAAPEATVAVTLGRGSTTDDGTSSSDSVVRRAQGLVASATTMVEAVDRRPPIRIGRLVASLVGERYDVGRDRGGYVLRGEVAWTPRTLMGRPTPCVAREAELATLRALFESAADEPMARVVLVTAAAGTGKSRLRYEFLRGLRARGEDVEVLIGRGDAVRSGAPHGLLVDALRTAAGMRDGEPAEVALSKLHARVPEDAAEFLAELMGIEVGEPSVQVAAARTDPLLMADQVSRAFARFLEAECALRPVVLVLEDLQWGDAATVRVVDHALRTLADVPLMVLALARPEVEEHYPRLWAEREPQHLRLGPLPKRAARTLARDVLGELAEDAAVKALVERAAGNAFYLEELLRAAAEGDPWSVPDTVLTMVQARLEAMEPGARRVLRAGSVFGRTFWAGGVDHLVGASAGESIELWLRTLEEREVVSRRPVSRLVGQIEYVFRHDLMREAAYAMLTDADRQLGHRLAGGWLAERGGVDAAALAEHFDRGGDEVRAVEWYLRAARHALDGYDLDGAEARAVRGLECGAAKRTRGELLAVLTEVRVWRGRFPEAVVSGEQAMEELEPGSPAWLGVVADLAMAAGVQGDGAALVELTRRLIALPIRSDAIEARVAAATRLAEQLLIVGRVEPAEPLFAEMAGIDEVAQPASAGRMHSALALRACFVGDVEANLRHVDQAVACFERAGDERGATTKRERAGYTRLDLGAYGEAEGMLRAALADAERLQLGNVAATALHNLGLTLGRLGRAEEAAEAEREAARRFHAAGNRRMEGASYEYLALIWLEHGDLDKAHDAAERALELAEQPPVFPLNRAESLAILARVKLAQGRVDDALQAAGDGVRLLESLGGIDDGESIIRLTWAEALYAAGETERAIQAILLANERLDARAERMSEPWRTRFLEDVPENRETRSRRAEWLA